MTLVLSARDGPELQQRWRQQVAGQRRRRLARGPRPLAAVSFLTRGPAPDGLVDIRHLTFVVLYDQRQVDGPCAIRCAVYAAASAPWGARIGGAEGCKLDKNLALAPGPGAKGRRFDAADGQLLSLALGLDQLLERHGRYPRLPRRSQPRWPKLWAGFAPQVAREITLAGPEFESDERRAGRSTVPSLSRSVPGLALLPLAYASHAWRRILAIYADLPTIPKRQVIHLEPNARNLRGYDGAIEFDLVSSRFSSLAAGRRRTAARNNATATWAS